MGILIILIFLVLAGFALVILVGPPYLPTTKNQIEAAFELLDLKPGQTILELGSGDGRVLIAAAQKGYRAVGLELNPWLVIISKLRTYRYRDKVVIKWGNIWTAKWPPADAIFTFLLERYMPKLREELDEYNRDIKIASFAFKIPNLKLKHEQSGVYLYEYEASHKLASK